MSARGQGKQIADRRRREMTAEAIAHGAMRQTAVLIAGGCLRVHDVERITDALLAVAMPDAVTLP